MTLQSWFFEKCKRKPFLGRSVDQCAAALQQAGHLYRQH